MVTGGAWGIYNAIHLLWHVLHLEVFPAIDKISIVGILSGLLILSVLLMLRVTERAPVRSLLTTGRRQTPPADGKERP